jgi:hypothetical protein
MPNSHEAPVFRYTLKPGFIRFSGFVFMFCLTIGCDNKIRYLENRFEIESFSLKPGEIQQEGAILNIKVRYLSDSTHKMGYFSAGIEKGQNGPNSQILFFGDPEDQKGPEDCGHMSLAEFSEKYNNRAKEFMGQKLHNPIRVCPLLLKNKNSKFVLVRKDMVSGRIDTLHNTL